MFIKLFLFIIWFILVVLILKFIVRIEFLGLYFVEFINDLYDFVWIIYNWDQVDIFRVDVVFFFQYGCFNLFFEFVLKFVIYQNDGYWGDFIGLNQGEYFKEFVECIEIIRQCDEGLCKFDEYYFVDEEIFKVDIFVVIYIRVGILFKRKVNIEVY